MQSIVEVNGVRVVEAEIKTPWSGAWHAWLTLDTGNVIAGAVELVVADLAGGAATTLRGTVLRAGAFGERTRVLVVGGAGGLRLDVRARAYHSDAGVRAQTVAQDAIADAGESLAPGATSSVLGRDYVRPRAPASEALDVVVPGWYVGADGKVSVVARAAGAAPGAHELLTSCPGVGTAVVAADSFAAVVPGVTIPVRTGSALAVKEACFVLYSDKIRIHAWGMPE